MDRTADSRAPFPDLSLDHGRPADAVVPDVSFTTFQCFTLPSTVQKLAEVGNVAVFQGCDGTSPSKYLLVWKGAVAQLATKDVTGIKDAHPALINLHGVWGAGVTAGGCCTGSTNAACLSLYVSANSVTVLELAKSLNTVFGDVTECFGLVADVPGFTGPRCAATDPRCEPETCGTFDPVCCWTPKFDPTKNRVPTLDPSSPLYSLELPQKAGECTYDGECVLNGCGNHCTAYSAPTFPAICSCYAELNSSLCGCVGGTCIWYEQK